MGKKSTFGGGLQALKREIAQIGEILLLHVLTGRERIACSGGWLTMKAADFRRIALSLEGTEEGSHMGGTDFRIAGRIFATLASEKHGYGNLMLTREQQTDF